MAQKATLETINIDKYVKVDEGQGFQNYITPLDENNMNNIEQGIVNLNNLGTGVDNVLNRNFTALNNAIEDINTLPPPEELQPFAGNTLLIDNTGNITPTPFSYNGLSDKLQGSSTISIDNENKINLNISPTFNAAIIDITLDETTAVEYNSSTHVITIKTGLALSDMPGNNLLHIHFYGHLSIVKDS